MAVCNRCFHDPNPPVCLKYGREQVFMEPTNPVSTYINGNIIPRNYIIQDVLLFLLELVSSQVLKSNPSMMNCYKLLWRMRTIPYVRLDELTEFAEKYWMNYRCKSCCSNLRRALYFYENMFPDLTTGPVTPRSLKHLSRCTIRKSLNRDSRGKLEIIELQVPIELKQYLRLEF
ncbi:hypothetical protein JTE90_021669 [Oedothorax gibbosus]|uniref:SOCS box domain-containing protein n=1 Tax=Oedothorax gibbosus TaxID=931172 RepID=A0AAV6TMQ6_9ARAC|nr:hypothetical protein JTE90_021669 [Oedothorax gibbosus]